MSDMFNDTGAKPSARSLAAGGVYPGSDKLWVSMGSDAGGKKLSDTWVFNANSGEGVRVTVFVD